MLEMLDLNVENARVLHIVTFLRFVHTGWAALRCSMPQCTASCRIR